MTPSAGCATVLLSGGLDSTTCVSYYHDLAWSVRTLFVNYGQEAAHEEWSAANSVAKHYRAPLSRIDVERLRTTGGKICGRNAMLVCLALMQDGGADGVIALGIHAGTRYEDCSSSFVRAMQAIADVYTDGRTRIVAPFVNMTKQQVYDTALLLRAPIPLTYSCQAGAARRCDACPSCLDLKALDAREDSIIIAP